MTKPNSSNGGRPSRSGTKPVNGGSGGGGKSSACLKKPLRAVRALKQADNSVLRPPLETSVAGLRQAVRLFETSTPEVVHLMSYECDIIYECRVCKNLFRSVANFISHKRIYCTRRFNHVQNSQVVEDHTLLVDGVGGGDGGVEHHHHQPLPPTRITARQDLTTIVQQASMAQYYRDAEDKVAQREQTRFDATVHLQPIDNTTYGVYQTYETPGAKNAGSLMKDQVSELQNIMMMKEGVTLGPDGKILPNGSRIAPESQETPKKVHHSGNKKCSSSSQHEEHILSHHEHICGLCKIKFSSKKTLSHHTRNVHGSFRVAYTCPCCINLFTNTWSVMRHLAKVHRKTNDQVRRLRTQIQKKQVHADKLVKKHGDASKSPPSNSSPSSNKRLAATPDNSEWTEVVKKGSAEVLRCAGCRRQFERQAAFQSHTQICHKRMALCGKDEKNKMAATPKPHNSSEKRIGIQVRMNYCKSATASPSPSPVTTTSPKSRRSDRHKTDSCDRSSVVLLTPLDAASVTLESFRSRQNSKDRFTPELVTENGLKSSANETTATTRGRIYSKLKTKKIESISRLLMEAIGTREEISNCTPVVNGVKHCDDVDNNLVPKSNDTGDKCSRSGRASSCSVVVGDSGSDKSNNKCTDVERPSRLSRTKMVRLSSVDTNVSSKEDESVGLKSPGPLVVEVNGIHADEVKGGEGLVEDEQGQLSPSKEGVIRVLTRYQLKSICKKDSDISVKEEAVVEEEEVASVVGGEPEEMQLDRLREMFRSNIHYKTLQCLVCHEKMKNIIELKNHVADHFGCNNFRCTFAQCSFVTYARGECVRHIMRAHLKQNERHLAAGYIGTVDNTVVENNSANGRIQEVDHSAKALEKSSSTRRKRTVPLKKDAPAKNGNVVKQESVADIADAAESETADLKAKGGNNAKRRKLATAEERLPSPRLKCAAPDSTLPATTIGALQSSTADLNDSAQLQPVAGKESGVGGGGGSTGGGEREEPPPGHSSVSGSEKVEMTVLSASASESDEEATQNNNSSSTGEEPVTWRESLRSFRGFDNCTKEEVERMESRRSTDDHEDSQGLGLPAIADNCTIRTMVMNVIFGPDHVTASTTK